MIYLIQNNMILRKQQTYSVTNCQMNFMDLSVFHCVERGVPLYGLFESLTGWNLKLEARPQLKIYIFTVADIDHGLQVNL
jgi:hypothetical protein